MAVRATQLGLEVVKAGHLVRASALGVEVAIGAAVPPGLRASQLGVEVAVEALLAPYAPVLALASVADDDASFVGSAFGHPAGVRSDEVPLGRLHASTRWEVDVAGGDFSSPVATNAGEEDAAATLVLWAVSSLAPSTAYQVRARYVDELGQVSPWSVPLAFTTSAAPGGGVRPNTPVITLDAEEVLTSGFGLADLAPVRLSFNLSTYFSPIGSPHVRTEWYAIYDPDELGNFSPTNWVDQEVQRFPGTRWDPDVLFVQGGTYAVRARVQDGAGNFSAYSAVFYLTTEEFVKAAFFERPRPGEPVSGAAYQIELIERRRSAEDVDLDEYEYEVEYSLDAGATWVPLVAGVTDPTIPWDTTGLPDTHRALLRTRSFYDGEYSFLWIHSPWFTIDNSGDMVDEWDETPGSGGVAGWERAGDLAQLYSTNVAGEIVRLAPPVNAFGDGRGSRFNALGWPGFLEPPQQVRLSTTFEFQGNFIDGDPGPGGAYRFLPVEFARAGLVMGAEGTWDSTVPGSFQPASVKGICAVVRGGTVWPIEPRDGVTFGNRIYGKSRNGRLEVLMPSSYSLTPTGSLTQATLFAALNSFTQEPWYPFAIAQLPPPMHAIRMLVTVLSVNPGGSAYPGRFTVRVQATHHSRYDFEYSGQAPPEWIFDRVLYNVDLGCGIAGFAGWNPSDYLSNDGVSQGTFANFAASVVSTGDCGSEPEPPTPCADGFDVTFFDDTGLVPLVGSADADGFVAEASYYSGRLCPRPWMKVPERWGDVQVDYLTGSSNTGAMTVEVVDKRQDPLDQRSGHVTGNVAGRCVNRRVVVRRYRPDLGVHAVILDGICTGYSIDAGSLVTYRFQLRDTRDRERVPLFERNETLSLFPVRGPVLGYGLDDFGGTGVSSYLLPPAPRFVGNYEANSSTDGSLATSVRSGLLGAALFAGFPQSDFGDGSSSYPDVTIRWRSTLFTAPETGWTYLRAMPAPEVDQWTVWNAYGSLSEIADVAAFFSESFLEQLRAAGSSFLTEEFVTFGTPLVRLYFASDNPALLPGDGQLIEVQVLHAGEPTEQLPLYYDGTFGDLLRRVWDGYFNLTDPRIRYDEDRLEFLATATPPARMIVTERAGSMRDWLAENVFAPIGYVPRFDLRGLLYPVSDAVPAVAGLAVVDEDNAIPTGSGWDHSASNAAHEVDFLYVREYLAEVDGVPVLSSQPVRARILSPVSRDVIADPVEFRPVTVRSTGSGAGAVLGDVSRELGAILARGRADALLERYRFGAPVLGLPVRSGDPTAAALLPGDWCRVTLSWLPDYATGMRGIDRVMQVTGVVDEDVAVRVLTLTDGYPVATAPSEPIIGTITFDASGRAVVPITAVPSGGSVRVEYAVVQLQPAEDSSEWLLGGVLGAPGNVTTTVVPPGGIVWVRARAVTADGQPSAWVLAAAVQAGLAPFVFSATVQPQGSGYRVGWVVTPQTLGVRLEWGVHDPLEAPAYTASGDFAAELGSAQLAVTLTAGQRLSVRLEPWSGFGGAAVSGSAGTPIVRGHTFVDPDQAFLTSVGVVRTGVGSCPAGIPIEVSWAGGGTDYGSAYTVRIVRFVAAASPFYLEDWTSIAEGLVPTAGSFDDLFAGRTYDESSGAFTSIVYRVQLVHTASGLTVAEREAPTIGVYAVLCP